MLFGAVLLYGQNQPGQSQPDQSSPADDTPISTDRPAIAESSVVVPRGSFQAENGLLITSDPGQRTVDGPETSLRFGVANDTELRLSAPDYYYDAVSGTGLASGFGDITIGIKQQLGPADGFDLSAIVFLSLPTGAAAISSHGYDPGLQLPWSRKLSANWTAAGQIALYWPTTQVDTRTLTGESTFLLDRQITNPLDAFIEYAGDFPQRGGPRHLLHVGAAFKITPRQQLDIHYGIGLSSAAINHFIGLGYSFRFQAFRR
jgi:hypothetical protein